jgi:hypothetical protein
MVSDLEELQAHRFSGHRQVGRLVGDEVWERYTDLNRQINWPCGEEGIARGAGAKFRAARTTAGRQWAYLTKQQVTGCHTQTHTTTEEGARVVQCCYSAGSLPATFRAGRYARNSGTKATKMMTSCRRKCSIVTPHNVDVYTGTSVPQALHAPSVCTVRSLRRKL